MEDSVVCTHFNIRLIGRKEIQNRFEISVCQDYILALCYFHLNRTKQNYCEQVKDVVIFSCTSFQAEISGIISFDVFISEEK